MVSLTVLCVHHPLRPANWRWERANVLYANNISLKRSTDDHYIARTLKYLRDRLDAGADLQKRELLYDRFGSYHVAHEIYTDDDKRMRYMLEAWLLAHIPIEQVAVRTSMPPDVVRYYEAMYFNVLDRMDRGDWIMGRVLPQAVYEGVQQRDFHALWKLVAYVGGEFVLEAFLRMATDPNRPTGREGINPFLQTQSDNTQYRGRLANTWGMRTPDAHTRLQFEELCLHMDEIRANTGGGGAPNDYVVHVEAMMRSLQFGIGMEGRTAPGTPSLGPASPEEAGGREPRAIESLLQRAGLPVPVLVGMPPLAYPERTTEPTQGIVVGE